MHGQQLEHLVLFKWKEATTEEEIAYAMKRLLALKSLIPDVLAISIGKNITEARAKGARALRANLDVFACARIPVRCCACARKILACACTTDA